MRQISDFRCGIFVWNVWKGHYHMERKWSTTYWLTLERSFLSIQKKTSDSRESTIHHTFNLAACSALYNMQVNYGNDLQTFGQQIIQGLNFDFCLTNPTDGRHFCHINSTLLPISRDFAWFSFDSSDWKLIVEADHNHSINLVLSDFVQFTEFGKFELT